VRTSKTITLAALLLTAASSPAMASGNTAQLNVSAQILPTACELSTGASAISFSWKEEDRLDDAYVEVISQKIPIAVRCNAPTRFGLYFTDDHPLALAGGAGLFVLAHQGQVVSLMQARLYDGLADGVFSPVFRKGPSLTFDHHMVVPDLPQNYMAWSTLSATEASTDMLITSFIPSRRQLDVTDDMVLEGRMSMELVYL